MQKNESYHQDIIKTLHQSRGEKKNANVKPMGALFLNIRLHFNIYYDFFFIG